MKNSKLQLKNEARPLLSLHPAVILDFIRGCQAETRWVLGYGPRKVGTNTLDLSIFQPSAPDVCFEILPTPEGISFKTSHPSVVKLNGQGVRAGILHIGDIIKIHDTEIESGLHRMNLIPKSTGTFRGYAGTENYYEVHGRGRPLILITESAASRRPLEARQIRHFSETHQVIVYDSLLIITPGSQTDRNEMNIDALAKNLKALISHLAVENAGPSVDTSFGVQMLMSRLRSYPELFSGWFSQ